MMRRLPLVQLLVLLASLREIAFGFSPVRVCQTPTTFHRAVEEDAADAAVSAAQLSQSATVVPRIFKFRGHDVYSEVSGEETNRNHAILIHGFGCSTVYWRSTFAALAEAGYVVHAIDLLGQGQSDKPGKEDGVVYSINLWAELVDEYAREYIQKDSNVVLFGNSLGSVVALSAATADYTSEYVTDDPFLSSRVSGIGMFNCGVGMNTRNILKEPQWQDWQKVLLKALFDLWDSLIFGNTWTLTLLLSRVITRDLLKDALRSLYPTNPDRVDDDLIESFYTPATVDVKASVEVIKQIYTNDAGVTPMELHERYKDLGTDRIPLHLVWGDNDAVTPLGGGVGTFYSNMAKDRTHVTMDVLNCGHIPFDEQPDKTNASVIGWMDRIGLKK